MADKEKADAVAPQTNDTDSTDSKTNSKTDSSSESKKDTLTDSNDTDTKTDDKVEDTTTDSKDEAQANGHETNGDSNGVKDDEDKKEENVVEEMEKKEEEMEEKVDKETEAAGEKAVAEEESGDVEAEVEAEDVEEDEAQEEEEEAESREQSVADVTMADTTTDSIDAGDSSAFPPGTIVLAKVKGFPAWPGMVVPEDVLPSSVLNAKPRKNRQMWPVRFFVDTTHTWAYRNDLKPLGVAEAAKFLKSASRGRKDKSLHAAYKMASEPPSLDEFVEQVYGDVDEEDEEEEEEPEEKPPAKKRKTSAKASTPASKTKASAVKEAIKEAKKKSGQPATRDSGKEAAKETKGGAAAAKGGAKADAKSASASPALSSKPKSSPVPKRSDKEGKVLVIRHKLQRGLLSGSVPEDSDLPALSQYLSRLEEFEGLETSIIRQTKINKVLKGIVKLESVPKDEEYGFKERSLKLLTAWNKLE